ncbi:MAG: SulP family inorganic anion transporter [Aestuariivirga sp.]|uniref:SulP family inorganic anion transporter n=1 Tax=Aestuariivirga sp. TaxID=2650926 RepID=UPI0025BF091E|nr:SulP family inorganic anion transporter [Aestuariivirga sp.]MCA3562585.1 SulP family inorganic anion transporter [Aestuariivirga sp.]
MQTPPPERRLSRVLPPLQWLPGYRFSSLPADVVAGITLAAYAIPVSLAYAGLAGLPPQLGVYGYLLGGIGYALFGSSRQLAVGPTSAISLMVASSVSLMAAGDSSRYLQIASLAAMAVALLALLAWAFRLSVLVKLISDSILVGFKAGAGLTIAMTQLPSLLGVPGGGHGFLDRVWLLLGQLSDTNLLVLAVGGLAVCALVAGGRFLPGRPVALAVVCAAIILATLLGLPGRGVPVTGFIPPGLPTFAWPGLRLRDVEGILPLAGGVLLLAYIEGVSAARSFAVRHGYEIDPRQEFLGIGAANLAAALGQGYPVAGGLSQSAVNDRAGARSPLALLFASLTLALCLMFLTGLLQNLPKAVLAAVVLTAVAGLIDIPALWRMSRISRIDFLAALVALVAVLLLGILNGVLAAALASAVMLLVRASRPHVAFLGRIPGSREYSDLARHPENVQVPGVLIFRPEANLIYVNADAVLETVLARVALPAPAGLRLAVCDLSASPFIDLAGAAMLHRLAAALAERNIRLRIVDARAQVRELLRADGLADKVGGIARGEDAASVIEAEAARGPEPASSANPI